MGAPGERPGMEETRVAACQVAVEDLAVGENLATMRRRVRRLADDVALAVFPEYALTGFVADERAHDAAVPADGDAVAALAELAVESDLTLVVGFLEDAGEETYNAVAVVGPDGERSVYRKRHLWAGEAAVLTAGEDRLVVETPAGTAGVATCYDLNFVADSAAFARERVELLVVPAAWPATYSENWRLLARARALDGVRYVVGAGRTGRRELPDAPATEYAGRSLVVRPDGTVMAARNRTEGDVVATLSPAELREQRSFVDALDDPGLSTFENDF